MRKWGRSQSFLEQAKFYVEWSNYSYDARNGVFLKSLTKRYIFQLTECEHESFIESIDSDNRSFSSVKPQQIFQNILFLECSKKDQTYISDILTLFEYILTIKIKNIF